MRRWLLMARDDDRKSTSKTGRLDSPLTSRRSLKPSVDPEQFGKISERIARWIGSWRFIAYMTIFIIGWVIWNIVADEGLRPDEYPFIFLTLLLSLQASYAAPLILLAQNRQTDRDRVTYAEDRARTERLMSETEFLSREIAALRIALGEVATRDFVRGELRELLEELEEQEKPEKPSNSKAEANSDAPDTSL
jgi:uncharacterized membrane protein